MIEVAFLLMVFSPLLTAVAMVFFGVAGCLISYARAAFESVRERQHQRKIETMAMLIALEAARNGDPVQELSDQIGGDREDVAGDPAYATGIGGPASTAMVGPAQENEVRDEQAPA